MLLDLIRGLRGHVDHPVKQDLQLIYRNRILMIIGNFQAADIISDIRHQKNPHDVKRQHHNKRKQKKQHYHI